MLWPARCEGVGAAACADQDVAKVERSAQGAGEDLVPKQVLQEHDPDDAGDYYVSGLYFVVEAYCTPSEDGIEGHAG